jgi:hypothetical protein
VDISPEQILQMCYEQHTEFEESPEHDEFFLDNPVLWPFCWEEHNNSNNNKVIHTSFQ